MNLTDLRSRVRYLTRIPDEHNLPTADIDGYLNEAYRELARMQDWPSLAGRVTLPVPAGTDRVELPAAVRRVSLVVAVDGKRRSTLGARTAEGLMLESVERGTEPSFPDLYWASEETGGLTLYPVPERPVSLELAYYTSPSPLVGPDDVPVFAADYHDALAYRAAALILLREEEDPSVAQSYAARFDQIAADMSRYQMAARDRGRLTFSGRRARPGRLNPRRTR